MRGEGGNLYTSHEKERMVNEPGVLCFCRHAEAYLLFNTPPCVCVRLRAQTYAVVMYTLIFAWAISAAFITIQSKNIVLSVQSGGNSGVSNTSSSRRAVLSASVGRNGKNKRNQTIPVDAAEDVDEEEDAGQEAMNGMDGMADEMGVMTLDGKDNDGDDAHDLDEDAPDVSRRSGGCFPRFGQRNRSSRGGHSNKLLRKLAAIHHRLNVACYILYAITCKMALTLLHCPSEDPDADCHTEEGQRPPGLVAAMQGLVVFHLILFPLAAFLAAARVHRRNMGGSCCADTPRTVESQLCNHRTDVEVALWRYFLHSDLRARYVVRAERVRWAQPAELSGAGVVETRDPRRVCWGL